MKYFEPDLDFDLTKPGLNKGHVHFYLEENWLDHEIIKIPIVTIINGNGPTILLTSGNHGDEYEGIITLKHIIKEINSNKVYGKIIILPFLNLPAVIANTRSSPIDGKNLNRIWPGSKTGTISERIVHWVSENFFIKDYYFMDFHTGGRLLKLIPMSLFHFTNNKKKYNRLLELQRIFNSQLSVELNVKGKRMNTAGAYANKKGLYTIGSESGGGQVIKNDNILNCYNGLRNILDYLGIYESNLPTKLLNNNTIYTKKSGTHGEVKTKMNGLFIPYVNLWDRVRINQKIAHIVNIFDNNEVNEIIYASNEGIVAGIRNYSPVNKNDTLFWIVQHA